MDVDVPPMGIDAARLLSGDVFCGIDPGREKFGFALASEQSLLFAAIVPFERFDAAISYLSSGSAENLAEWRTEGIVCREAAAGVFLGNGTSHKDYERGLREAGVNYKLADERMTTLDARELYWKLHPPRGLARLAPKSLRVPPRPIDDFAAWAIIRKHIDM